MMLEMQEQSVSVLRVAEIFPEIARATLSDLRAKRKKPLVNVNSYHTNNYWRHYLKTYNLGAQIMHRMIL